MRLSSFSITASCSGKTIVFTDVPWQSGSYEQQSYVLTLQKSGSVLKLTLNRKSGRPFVLDSIQYDFELDLINYGRVLIPDSGRFYMNKSLPRQVWDSNFYVTGIQMINPFFALCDAFDQVDFSFGLLGYVHETDFHFYSPGRNEKNSLTVKGGISGGKLQWSCAKPVVEPPLNEDESPDDPLSFDSMNVWEDALFQSQGEKTWFHALRKYGKAFRTYHGMKYTRQKYGLRPALCTWRVISSDDMTHEWIVRQAQLCRETGIEALIFDDGWYAVGLDGKGVRSWMGDWHYQVEKTIDDYLTGEPNYKFEDVRKTVEEVKREGVAPILWFCPVGVSPDSRRMSSLEKYLVKIKHRDEYYQCPARFHILCCRNPEARQIMADNISRLVEYGADGIKNDLFDYMPASPCTSTEHTHDVPTTTDGVRLAYEAMWQAVLKANPECIYSVKNNDGNVELAPLASNVRGGDSPFDENINILRSIYPSAFAPVVHNDYLAFTNWEKPDKVAILMIKQICTGVPNFSLDLENLKPAHKHLLKTWLDFFKSIRDLYGTFNFEPQNPQMTVFQRWNDEKAHITLLYPAAREIQWFKRPVVYVTNATSHDTVYVTGAPAGRYRIEQYDHRLRKVKTVTRDLSKDMLPVLSAGMSKIKKLEGRRNP
jgi:hypothetical protein